MNNSSALRLLLPVLSILASVSVSAQASDTSVLFKKLKAMDSLVFEEGFNKCHLGVYDSIVADDLEFYHDKGGITNGRTAFIASVKNNICGSKNKMQRELVAESMQVYPLYNNNKLYGAIQQGVHRFSYLENGKWKRGNSTARFIHLWLLENGSWKLKRVLSYDH